MIIYIAAILITLVFPIGMQSEAFATPSEQKPFLISLPDNWIQKSGIPYAYANSEVSGNYILVDITTSPKKFSSRDDFHEFIKSEYLKTGFGLGNSITTVSTDYGFKSAIELSLKKSDGSVMTMRKDYHYVSGEQKLFEIHGYSSDLATKFELKKTLNTFRPT